MGEVPKRAHVGCSQTLSQHIVVLELLSRARSPVSQLQKITGNRWLSIIAEIEDCDKYVATMFTNSAERHYKPLHVYQLRLMLNLRVHFCLQNVNHTPPRQFSRNGPVCETSQAFSSSTVLFIRLKISILLLTQFMKLV